MTRHPLLPVGETPPYASFWMGGFEGADHRNSSGAALDMATSSGHVERLDEDYRTAADLGLTTVRESIGWRLCEPAAGRYDLRRPMRMAQAARRHGVQILWSLMHYGTPDDTSLLDDAMIERFAAFAREVARVLAPWSDQPPVYTPINEIGFLAWAVSETNLISPYRGDPSGHGEGRLRSGYAVKRRLVRAALAAMAAMKAVDPRARFLHIEPMVHVTAPRERDDLRPLAAEVHGYQWHAWDLLAGRLEPELGGSEGALDLIGVNHYHSGQWDVLTGRHLDWQAGDPGRRPPADLLRDVWLRYGRPVLVAETSHVGDGRAQWLDHMAAEIADARAQGVPVAGVCLYPLVDRPDWERPDLWHRSGLLDVLPPAAGADEEGTSDHVAGPRFERFLQPAYAASLARWQSVLPRHGDRDLQTVIVFSHLRWGFVHQRPQQLMSRLARRHRIVFVEEPVHDELPHLVRSSPASGIEVLCPHTPILAQGFRDEQIEGLQKMLARFLQDEAIAPTVAWLYTPMALPLLEGLAVETIVYDCMSELSSFVDAPPALRWREPELMRRADIVITAGPSLCAARLGANPALHCLPHGVEAAHFAPERLLRDSWEAHAARRQHAGLGTPRIGFFGVVDERMDLDLVAALADARPQWQWVLAGPVVKIDPGSLPRRANLHWLGVQPYAVLPYLAADWDVCMVPFARNEATRSINPTKVLEYLAAGKPVVSTAVGDVGLLYGDVVHIARNDAEFIAACELALGAAPAARAQRRSAARRKALARPWDHAVAAIESLLQQRRARQAGHDTTGGVPSHGRGVAAPSTAPPTPAPMEEFDSN